MKIEKVENVYGIPKVNMTGEKCLQKSAFIYAPNGTFKSSFTTFLENLYKNPKDIRDRFDETKKAKYKLTIFGKEIDQDCLQISDSKIVSFSLDKYIEYFMDRKFYSRLAYKTDIIKQIIDAETKIKQHINPLLEIAGFWGIDKENIDFFNLFKFKIIYNELMTIDDELFTYIKGLYKKDKSLNFKSEPKTITSIREDKDILELKKQYLSIKNGSIKELITGKFDIIKATDLINFFRKDTSFFDVGHKVKLFNGKDDKNFAQLEELYNNEIKSLLSNGTTKESYEKIQKTLYTNKNTIRFAELFEKDPKFIDYLSINNVQILNCLQWLIDNDKDLNYYKIDNFELVEEIIKSTEKIVDAAKDVELEVVEIFKEFNSKFINYLEVKIENQKDVILKKDLPIIDFKLKGRTVKKEDIQYLSSGEKRALAFIHFYIDVRLSMKENLLILIDDGTESFDYTYKYAFVSYLLELMYESNIQLIVLSHNFDFIRTIYSRTKLMNDVEIRIARRIGDTIYLRRESLKGLPKPCEKYENNLSQIVISRELDEITNSYGVKDMLTNFLHIKSSEIYNYTLEDIYVLCKKTGVNIDNFKGVKTKYFESLEKYISDYILDSQSNDLAIKICHSIIIRLKVEEYILKKYYKNDYSIVKDISLCQTQKLIMDTNLSEEEKKLFLPVLVYTPEFIHINSLSYDPLYDVSMTQLVELWKKIKIFIDKN